MTLFGIIETCHVCRPVRTMAYVGGFSRSVRGYMLRMIHKEGTFSQTVQNPKTQAYKLSSVTTTNWQIVIQQHPMRTREITILLPMLLLPLRVKESLSISSSGLLYGSYGAHVNEKTKPPVLLCVIWGERGAIANITYFPLLDSSYTPLIDL